MRFAEGLTPRAVEVDAFGHAAALRFARADGTEAVLPARAILVAAGTQPNTVLAREDGRIKLDGRYFQAIDETGAPVTPVRGLAKPDATQVLMHRAAERPLRQLLRRPAPELLRQRGEGDGRGEARLSRRLAACWRAQPAIGGERRGR